MLKVLYVDNHCLAVEKPPRMLTMPDRTGDASLYDLAKSWLREKYHKPGKVYLGLLHRLDRPVSGIVLFARTSKAAARLSAQFRERTIGKVYCAIVEGKLPPGELLFEDWLLKDPRRNVARRVAPGRPGARLARMQVCQSTATATRVILRPATGRAHQIRAQLAARGFPIVGDLKYGARRGWGGRIALHASQLTFEHPISRQPVTINSDPPADWKLLLERR